MPWCPKCKCEYRDGITECVDCKVPLVEELPTNQEEAFATEFATNEDGLEEQSQEMLSEKEDAHKTEKESVGVYQDKKAKAEDFKSSAYTLLIVGILGLVALVLIELGVLPIHLAAPGKYITYTVMGVMFLIFIITGISSFRSSQKYEKEAETEDKLTASIKDWVLTNLTSEMIQEKAKQQEDTEEAQNIDLPKEMQYFRCYAVLKTAISEQFGELDESYLDALCEDLYGLFFDE